MQTFSFFYATPPKLARCLAAFALATAVCAAGPLAAQDTTQTSSAPDSTKTLKEALRANRYSLQLKADGKLRGAGGRWLREKAAEASIVTLGESHGTKEIPHIMSAFLADLLQAGEVNHLALEVSPWMAEVMTSRLRANAYDDFIKANPAAVPFYNLKAERDLVRQIIERSDKKRPLWGLDQIFAFATGLALDRLEELAPSEEARRAVREVRAAGQARSADDPRLRKLPASLPPPLTVYPPATFDTLRSRFEGIEEAQVLLEEMETSTRIYRLNDTDNYASNQLRARYLRGNLRRHVRRARQRSKAGPPQVVLKIGAAHAYRGLSPNNALDVGNLSVSLARAMDEEALNVAILCGPGSQGRTFPAGTSACWQEWLGPAFKALARGENPVLFDLAALRPLLHEGPLEPGGRLEDFLWAFDAVVLVPDARPAEPIASPADR